MTMRNLTLATKTVILLTALILLATGPLVWYCLKAVQGIGALGTDSQIEAALARGIDLAHDKQEKQQAAVALKRYAQIKVLKDRIVSQVALFSALYASMVIGIALGLGWLSVSRITRPLKELTAATRRLAADRFEGKLPEKSGGEVGELVRAFNAMVGDLATARERQAAAERRATWQTVARTIAHEIKNPLTPIRLSTERMYEKYLDQSKDFPEVIRSTTSTVLTEIANLQKLVDTFHRYAKFPDPVLARERLGAVVRETVGLYTGSPVPVETSIDETLPEIKIDKGQIREAVTNLLKNAFEAVEDTGRPPRIEVAVRRDADCAVVSVRDNGCGISEESRKKLFQPYYTTKKQGSGIGLALIERIVTLHGGTITVESTERAGTEVIMRLPITT